MVDQFEAEKCLYALSTDNLVLTITDNRSHPKAAPRQPLGNPSGNFRAIQMGQIPGPELKVGAKPRGLPGGCWPLELTDALEKLFAHHME